MNPADVLAVIAVSNFDISHDWYHRLFDESATNVPMPGNLVEWRLTNTGWPQILCALMDGRAHTGSELARHIGVVASTISEHLSRLFDADIVTVETQGRHRYWRLADPGIAELLETLGANATSPTDPKAPPIWLTPEPATTTSRANSLSRSTNSSSPTTTSATTTGT